MAESDEDSWGPRWPSLNAMEVENQVNIPVIFLNRVPK